MSYKHVRLNLQLGGSTILILLMLSKSLLSINSAKMENIYNVLTCYNI